MNFCKHCGLPVTEQRDHEHPDVYGLEKCRDALVEQLAHVHVPGTDGCACRCESCQNGWHHACAQESGCSRTRGALAVDYDPWKHRPPFKGSAK